MGFEILQSRVGFVARLKLQEESKKGCVQNGGPYNQLIIQLINSEPDCELLLRAEFIAGYFSKEVGLMLPDLHMHECCDGAV